MSFGKGECGIGDMDRASALERDRRIDRCIERLAASDTEALGELYMLAKTPIFTYALSLLKNRHDAEDVLEETFLRIYRSAATYRPLGKPMAWIMTITRHLCYERLSQLSQMRLDADTEAAETEGAACLSVDSLILRECLSLLSEEEREIVMLHAVSGMKHREIAAYLRRPLPTVLSKYRRALRKMKDHLED